MTPAEERAEREGLPVINPVPHELLSAASGHPIIVTTTDGNPVLLRLPTVDEFVAANLAAVASLPEFCRPAPVSRESAEYLVRPLDLGGVS